MLRLRTRPFGLSNTDENHNKRLLQLVEHLLRVDSSNLKHVAENWFESGQGVEDEGKCWIAYGCQQLKVLKPDPVLYTKTYKEKKNYVDKCQSSIYNTS